jgi:hypothetical protein
LINLVMGFPTTSRVIDQLSTGRSGSLEEG